MSFVRVATRSLVVCVFDIVIYRIDLRIMLIDDLLVSTGRSRQARHAPRPPCHGCPHLHHTLHACPEGYAGFAFRAIYSVD